MSPSSSPSIALMASRVGAQAELRLWSPVGGVTPSTEAGWSRVIELDRPAG
jgi:hypothetical protein